MIRSRIDPFRGRFISGWVYDDENFDRGVEVSLWINDILIDKRKTDQMRVQLKSNGRHPTGLCGFKFENPQISLLKNLNAVRMVAGNTEINGISKNQGDDNHVDKEQLISSDRILVVGLNKSGTSILTYRIAGGLKTSNIYFEPGGLESLSDFSIHEKFTTNSNNYITKSLFYPSRGNLALKKIADLYTKRVWIIRDPRDVIISAFFYTWTHLHKQPENLFKEAFALTQQKITDPDSVSFTNLLSIVSQTESRIERLFTKFCDTIESLDSSWFIYRYEDLVEYRTSELNQYLGFSIEDNSELGPGLNRVARTKSSGNWRDWFTKMDVEILKPILAPILRKLGYDHQDWVLNDSPILSPTDSTEYMSKIHYGKVDETFKVNEPYDDRLFPPSEFLNYQDRNAFFRMGDRFLEKFISLDVDPDDRILEIGSGVGRIGRCFTTFLNNGQYVGIDIVKKFVDWANDAYDIYPNIDFLHLNIENAYYNSEGENPASRIAFPFSEESFDFIYLTSVFTHMYKESIRNYLLEIERLLKPGKRCLATFFVIDEDSIKAIQEQRTKRSFQPLDDQVSYVFNPQIPEAAIGFDRSYLMGLFEEVCLEVESVEEGVWRNKYLDPKTRKDRFNQDIIVLRKPQ